MGQARLRSRLLSWLGTAISGPSMGGVTRCPASLQRLDALKRPMDVEQLALQRLLQTLNPSPRCRGMDLGQPVGDARVEPAGEYLAVGAARRR